MPSPVPTPRRKNGRPTKRTEAVLKPLFEAIRIGVPYKLACYAAGISYECFAHWRQTDPAFDAEVEQAAAEPAVKLFKTIREQAPETWQAGAWSLERRYPDMFARPEAQMQLNVLNQTAVLNGNEVARNAETVIVSDLEFVGLRRHPAYKHEPSVCKLEQVPAEVSGSLKREGHNIVVISESKAAARAKRSAEIRAKTLALFAAHNQGNDSRETGEQKLASQSASTPGPSNDAPKSSSEAERFASAVQQMPSTVKDFFQSED